MTKKEDKKKLEQIRDENYQAILDNMKGRAALKQVVYKEVHQIYKEMVESLETLSGRLREDISGLEEVEVELRELNPFESMLKFGSDVLIFSMHTNVFYVNPAHFIHKNAYVKRSEENTSELQSLMRISYAVFCL